MGRTEESGERRGHGERRTDICRRRQMERRTAANVGEQGSAGHGSASSPSGGRRFVTGADQRGWRVASRSHVVTLVTLACAHYAPRLPPFGCSAGVAANHRPRRSSPRPRPRPGQVAPILPVVESTRGPRWARCVRSAHHPQRTVPVQGITTFAQLHVILVDQNRSCRPTPNSVD